MGSHRPADITLPLLKYLADGKRPDRPEWTRAVARALGLSPDDLAQKAASGETLYQNHCSWAWIHLRKARLIDGQAAGPTWITDLGLKLLQDQPDLDRIDSKALNSYAEYGQPIKTEDQRDEWFEFLRDRGITPEDIRHAPTQSEYARWLSSRGLSVPTSAVKTSERAWISSLRPEVDPHRAIRFVWFEGDVEFHK